MNPFSDKEFLLQQYTAVKNDIASTCASLGRNPDTVRLVVVSKFQPDTKIRWLLEANQREFGESRAEEMEEKWEALLSSYPDTRLHYIGQIQSRKIKLIVKYCHMIHSLDRIDIAEKMAAECSRQNKSMECLIQINTGAEVQKGGIPPDSLSSFLEKCRMISPLIIKGIMCIPPVNEDPLPHFQLMQQLKNTFRLDELSMGMSNDYSKAISCGASILRIGNKIMGDRNEH